MIMTNFATIQKKMTEWQLEHDIPIDCRDYSTIKYYIVMNYNLNKLYAKPTVLDLPLFTPAFSSSKIAEEFIETFRDELILLLNNS